MTNKAKRTSSPSLPYFELDNVMDTKVELLEAEFGIKGFAIFVKLLQRIYGGNGYYCEWDSEVELLFSKRLNEGRNFVSEVVESAISRGIFDSSMYEQFGILTSLGIQKRYFNAVKRRGKIEVRSEYLLVKLAQLPTNVCIIGLIVDRNAKNVDNLAYSQLKENKRKEKENERKEKDSIVSAAPAGADALSNHEDSEQDSIDIEEDNHLIDSKDNPNESKAFDFKLQDKELEDFWQAYRDRYNAKKW